MAGTQDVVVRAKVELEGGLTIGPNDILVLRMPMNTSDADYDSARHRLAKFLPDAMRGRVIIVVCEDFAKVEAS